MTSPTEFDARAAAPTPPGAAASLVPVRLVPGEDLRAALHRHAVASMDGAAFVVAGIGSLSRVGLRFAGADEVTRLEGRFEILTLSGSLAADGAHLHMSVSDAQGRVLGGHVGEGNLVRTTAEVLLATLAGWRLSRVMDARTGYAELRVAPRDDRGA